MESVIQKIRQARENENKKQPEPNANANEIIIDGCHVKMRFSPIGDSKIMPTIQSMLISAYFDTALASANRGESA